MICDLKIIEQVNLFLFARPGFFMTKAYLKKLCKEASVKNHRGKSHE